MTTKLYLRSATNQITGLPTTEQSSRTSANDFEANQATNRLLSTSIGYLQTSLANTSTGTASQTDYYIGRWVSPQLNQTSVSANTWTLNIATKESGAFANFPVGGAAPLYVNAYVWKPSNSTKYGTILDGTTTNTAFGPSAGTEQNYVVTFSGSAVSSLTAGDAVIVFEYWARVTQADTSTYTQTVYFNGNVDQPTDHSTVSNHASLISTPENLSFVTLDTKLYLHDTTTGIPTGTLPTAEQSSKTVTASCNFEGSQTTNRLMNSTIGASQASLALATPANTSANVYYVSRWVSDPISQTSVPAAEWEYNFGAKEDNAGANFPVTSTLKAVAVCCYVWKPSNGTKYGDIFDGNTASASYSEGAANTEVSEHGSFTGAAVSSLTSGDAIIVFEAWFNITQANATSRTATYYYDGTTETLATGTTVSNHASFINLLGATIAFAGLTQVNQTYTHLYKIALLVSQTRTHKYKIIGRIIQTYTHKYNIKLLVNRTRTFLYKIIGRIAQTYTHKYKIVGRIARSLTHIYKIVGRVAQTYTHKYKIALLVTATKTFLYKIRALVNQTYTQKYKIRSIVAKTYTHLYKIVGRAAQTFTHLYKIRMLVNQSYTHLYKLRMLVNRTRTFLYKIVGRASQIFTQLYKIRSIASQTYTHKYKVRQLASQTYSHLYKIIGRASQSFTHLYRIKLLVSQSYTHKYKIRQLVNQVFTQLYKIIGIANQTFTHKYKIALLVAQSFTHKYKIRQIAAQSFTHLYKIVSEQLVAFREFTHIYKIVGRVSETKTHKYNIKQLASQTFTHKWKIYQLINKQFTHIYKVIGRASQTFIHKYKIRLLVNQSFTHLYKLRMLVSVTKTFKYKIIGRIIQIYTHKYKIKQLVVNTFTHKYKLRQLVSSVKTFKYNIIGRAAQTFTHIYQILITISQVSQEFTHIYAIKQLVPKQYSFSYKIKAFVSQIFTFKYLIRPFIPLYKQPTHVKIPEGVSKPNRAYERDTESYMLKQLYRLVGRKYGINKRSRSG